jgi:hypothetical protein
MQSKTAFTAFSAFRLEMPCSRMSILIKPLLPFSERQFMDLQGMENLPTSVGRVGDET